MKSVGNFHQLLSKYLTVHLLERRQYSSKTIRAYKQAFNQYRYFVFTTMGVPFHQMTFDQFTKEHIYSFLQWEKEVKKCSINTLNQRLAIFKSFAKFCSYEDVVYTALYRSITTIHAYKGTKKQVPEYLNEAQLKLLFSLPDISTRIGRRDRFILIFLYETGVRIDELLSLRLSDFQQTDNGYRIRVKGKGDKIRYIPIIDDMIPHLKSYTKEFHPDTPRNEVDYLIYTVHNQSHTRMMPGTVDARLKYYAKQAVEKDFSFPENLHPHMMRHSIGMSMYKNDIPLSYIRDFLGHASISSTSIYAYADEETISKAIEKVANHSVPQPRKKWKGSEEDLIAYCGL